VLLLLRDFSVPSEQVCLLSDNLRALLPEAGLVNYPKRRHSGAPGTLRRGWLTRDAVFSMNGEPRL